MSRPMPRRVTTRAGNPPDIGDRGNTDYTGTPFAARYSAGSLESSLSDDGMTQVAADDTDVDRDSQWDDPLGADFSAGKADELEAEGKDPATCMFC